MIVTPASTLNLFKNKIISFSNLIHLDIIFG